jgi:hypothetical protein
MVLNRDLKGRREEMPTIKDNPPIEESALHSWRRAHWIDLGWNAQWADFLTDTQMDLSTARKMLEQGASHDQVLRILAGFGPLGEDPTFDWDKFEKRLNRDAIAALDERIEEAV